MRSFLVMLATALVHLHSGAAIQFTSPKSNSTLIKGSNVHLTWDFVNTDPTSFSIYLVNFVDWPPFYTPLQYNVDTTSGTASVRVPCQINNSYGYQFNAINGTNVYIIQAQTSKFSIDGDSCNDPEVPSTCAAVSTATVTVTATPKPCLFQQFGRRQESEFNVE